MLFTVYDIRDCLYDTKRTKQLARAIQAVVKKGDIVVDAGSGSGILALLALKAGAKTAYAIEMSKRHRQVIKRNAEINGYGKRIKIIIGDARKIKLPELVDVIICELIHTGTFFEPQMQVVQNLKKYLQPEGKILPEIMYSYIELVDAQERFYGLKLNYESRPQIKDTIISDKQKFDEIWFQEDEPLKLHTVVKLTAKKPATVNAVRITGRLKLNTNLFLGESRDILMPEIIYLKKPFKVSKGMDYWLEIKYEAGADTTNIHIKRLLSSDLTQTLIDKCTYLPKTVKIPGT